MRVVNLFAVTACSTALFAGSALADCRPLGSDVVAIGKQSAYRYSERSLRKAVESEKESIVSSGSKVGKVTKLVITCTPYANLIGADEWRCIGTAKVCVKR